VLLYSQGRTEAINNIYNIIVRQLTILAPKTATKFRLKLRRAPEAISP
jgi:hypothetical protein